jgi:chromosome segregation protein
MRIHRLEISGFKSFPDRSELLFDTGVTAIVGPNGCGKSNVVDAITWVLGEQSAKSLRGERMEDVIFGGSDARKPTAAAEVRLFLAGVTASARYGGGNGRDLELQPAGEGNAHSGSPAAEATALDGGNGHQTALALALAEPEPETIAREVQLSRRLYRSGESEYLIDGEVCRLRDVQDLLMDAGLGVKGYAVIEQGKIGQILSAKPTDRRQLIEEAAGVTKYKSRRRAAELKLEAAQQNLIRIDDIVFEVERQRGALKRQAARARRYRKLRDELRRWEKIAFARRYRLLAESIAAARARVADAQSREVAASTHLVELETSLEQRRIEAAEADTRAAAARQAAHASELELSRCQQQIELNKQQVQLLERSAETIAAELSTLDTRRGPAQEEARHVSELAAQSARDLTAAASRLAAADESFVYAQRQIEGLESDVEAARSEVFASINAATALRHAIDHAAIARERLAGTLEKLDLERGELQIELERTTRELTTVSDGLEQAQLAALQTNRTRGARERELSEARQERERQAADLKAIEHELAGLEARLRSLEELDASRAGYADAARLILGAGGEIAHMGAVADHLDVEPEYERAVEAYLGDLLQYVIVPDHADARAALSLVRKENAGRCGFVVASGSEDGTIGPRTASSIPGITPLEAVVRIGGPAADVVRDVIRSACVATSFGVAAEAAAGGQAPIATLDGVVFRSPRIIQGGGHDESLGILTIKREIKELRGQVQSRRSVLEQSLEHGKRLEEQVIALEAQVAELVQRLHADEKAILAFELQQAQVNDELLRATRKLDLVEIERRGAEEERASLTAREAEAREAVSRLEEEQRHADERLTLAQRRLFEARDAATGQGRQAAEARAAHAALVERAAAHAADARRLDEALRELEERLTGRRDELQRNETGRGALIQALAEGQQRLDEDLIAFDRLRENLAAAEQRVTECHALAESSEAAIRDARRALDQVRADLSELEVARATAETDLSHLATSCTETLEATLEDVVAEAGDLESQMMSSTPMVANDETDLGEDLEEGAAAAPAEPAAAAPATPDEAMARLREKINRLGPVNMMAIEQFDELEERHRFLTTQRQDLIDSIAATGEAIKRIDRTTRQRFQEAFAAINGHFQETFTTLFGGGRAGLVLLDESDVLETGIDIIAQPPGKRLQNVQLLSGGEKALTAMALMFGIFKYRPSPFCLLDEIDAPLDDANIGRFISMLEGMQRHTQFILITHNRKTMEIADRLYGVTMEEPGVSKLISLRLN